MSNPKKLYYRIIVLLMLLSITFTGCSSSSKHNSRPSNGGQTGQGSLKVKFALPHYPGIDFTERFTSKAIDPQTYKIRIMTKEHYDDVLEPLISVDLSFGTITESDGTKFWEASFNLAPYHYDTICVELLDNNTNPLTVGKARFVTVSRDNPTPITIGCLPVNHTAITTDGIPTSGSVIAGKMQYFSFHAINGGTYNISLTPSGSPVLYLFEPNGALKNDAGTGSFTATKTGIHYLGVYSQAGSDFQVSVATTSLPAPELNHLIINEISKYDYNDIIEIYNPTNDSINLSGWKLVVDYSAWSNNFTIDAFTIPPRSFAIIGIQDRPGTLAKYNLSDAILCPTSSSFWISDDNCGITLTDKNGTAVDYVQLNSGGKTPPPEMWNGSGVNYPNNSTIARKYDPLSDENTANDWKRSYGTIGLPNNADDMETVFIEVE